jgi:hypothetical protein
VVKYAWTYTSTPLIRLHGVIVKAQGLYPPPHPNRLWGPAVERWATGWTIGFRDPPPRNFYSESSPQMKLRCIVTNRRVKLRVWLGTARRRPWLRTSKVNHQPVRWCLHFFWDMEDAVLVHFTPKDETFNSHICICLAQWKKLQEEEDFHPIKKSLARCKICQRRDLRNFFFFWRNWRKTYETLEPVRWSRGGLRWKVMFVSFLYIYTKCAIF